MEYPDRFDVIVIGGGHAGTEAALASARMGCQTLLLTHNIETLGQMSCNPAIGGIGKSHLVKEIDALGGAMGLATDMAGIQFRTLNARKGPAVRATRAQADRALYKAAIRNVLENQPNLTLFQQGAEDLIVEGETAKVPGLWLPFHMEGSVRVEQGHLFVYEPSKIEVAKIEAKGLLESIRLQLSSLLDIETQGAEFSGNNVVLDLNHSLPPPAQDVNVANMSIDEAGVHLTFSSDFNPEFPPTIVDSDSYVMIQGGDIKTFRAVITEARLQMVAQDGGKLDASLYSYREQILAGLFDATPAGELVAYLGPYQPADYLPPAQPEDDDDAS